MPLRLVTLALAQTLDLVTFWLMVGVHGSGAEANPLVAGLLVTGGMAVIVAIKVALVVLVGSLGIAASAHVGQRVWALIGGLPVALGIAVGLIGGITNTAAFLN